MSLHEDVKEWAADLAVEPVPSLPDSRYFASDDGKGGPAFGVIFSDSSDPWGRSRLRDGATP